MAAAPGLLPELAQNGLQQLNALEASAVIGAGRHERSEERVTEIALGTLLALLGFAETLSGA